MSQYEIADYLQVERKGTICRKSPRIKAMIKTNDKMACLYERNILTFNEPQSSV